MRPAVREQRHKKTKWVLWQWLGAIAQLGERLHGMQEVGGSIPPGSTKFLSAKPSLHG